jgi:GTPase SAR1 family protein
VHQLDTENLEELARLIGAEKFALFYGAGVSKECGGPESEDLLRSLQAKFPVAGEKDFSHYMGKIIKFNNLNRREIESIVADELRAVSPSPSAKYLFSLPWRVIATTNYDTLPDDILSSLDGNRTVVPICKLNDRISVDQSRPDMLYCFKLMGDVRINYPNDGYMVLSEGDFRAGFKRREVYFRLMRNIATTGHIIYLGYSFKDRLIFDILEDMKNSMGELPWRGYAIIPSKPNDEILKEMDSVGIAWIQGTLTDFIDNAKRVFGGKPPSSSAMEAEFYVNKIPITLQRSIISNSWNSFSVMNKRMLDSTMQPDDFFERQSDSFYPFVHNWDFGRRIRITKAKAHPSQSNYQSLSEMLDGRKRNGNSSDNLCIALLGGAGSGKTVATRRIAYNWYVDQKPVIFIDPSSISMDEYSLFSLTNEIWKQFNDIANKMGVRVDTSFRYLIVADSSNASQDVFPHLRNYLQSMGKPADIIVVARKTEANSEKLLKSGFDIIAEIDDTLDPDEYEAFESHFARLNAMPDIQILRSNLRRNDINTSFFALIYTSIKGIQQPLASVVKDEFKRLDPNSKRVYRLAALLNSLNLSPMTTLVLHSLRLNEEWLNFEMKEGKLGGVLKFNETGTSILPFNRVVADIISDSAYQGIDETLGDLSKLIDTVTPGDTMELEVLHGLLIKNLPDRIFGSGARVSAQQMVMLLDSAKNNVKTRPLLLHLGIWQIKEGQFDKAYETLKEALTVQYKQFNEDVTHVYDELGRLELKRARKSVLENKAEEAIGHLEKAEEQFIYAKVDPNITPHPFHGLASTYLERAKLAETEEEKWHFLLLALDQCIYYEEYSGNSNNSDINMLKEQVLRQLTAENLEPKKIERLKSRYGAGNAYAFLSWIEEQKNNLKEAFQLTKKGLAEDSSSLWLIRQNVRLMKRLNPSAHDTILGLLEPYISVMSKRYDIQLSFYLAIELFAVERFRESQQIFKELSERSKANPRRLTPSSENRLYFKGAVEEFVGILSVVPKLNGLGRINSADFGDWVGGIPVRANDIQFNAKGGETVFFSIIFNMIGPEASFVRLANP